MNDSISRRHFLKQTGTAGIGLSVALNSLTNTMGQSNLVPAGKMGASKNITAAVIGTNGRGLAHIDCLTSLPGIEVIYICDVDDRAIAKGIKEVAKKQAKEPKGLKFFCQAEVGIRDYKVTGVQTCALPIWISSTTTRATRTCLSRSISAWD